MLIPNFLLQLHDDTGSMTAQLMIREVQSLITRLIPEGCNQNVADSNSVPDSAPSCTRNGIPSSDSEITNPSCGPSHLPTAGDFADEENPDLSADAELDADLDRELAAKADKFLDTVELVSLSEDGRTTTITRLGCLGKRIFDLVLFGVSFYLSFLLLYFIEYDESRVTFYNSEWSHYRPRGKRLQ